jgi:photosystem II stability/assembly factor-like uncharacterized protein
MKIIPQFLIMLCLFVVPVSGADWHTLPTGIEEDIRGLSFCDENDGYFITLKGNLLTYSASSSKIGFDSIDSKLQMEDIYTLPGCHRLLACGGAGTIMKSTDGGKKWARDTIGSEGYWFQDIAFIDSLTGFMAGKNVAGKFSDEGLLYRTTDGAKTWDSVSAPGRGLSSIDISPEGIISVTGMGFISISRDTGEVWEKYKVTSGNSVRATAIRGKNGIMLGMSGFLALSGDAGKSWQDYPVLPNDFHCFALLMMDDYRAYAVGSEGVILYTDNAGRDWIPEASGTANGLFKIQLIGNRIYCCGQKGTIIYTDLKK